MQPALSSNECSFEPLCHKSSNIKSLQASSIVPYQSLIQRFNKILLKGDTFLIYLLLQQATHSKSTGIMVQMINTLVQQAVNLPSK